MGEAGGRHLQVQVQVRIPARGIVAQVGQHSIGDGGVCISGVAATEKKSYGYKKHWTICFRSIVVHSS